MTTILEKCGASDSFIQNLIKRGLCVPVKIQKHPNPLHPSHAHELLNELEDQIPRFDEEQKSRYIDDPSRFYLDAVDSVNAAAWIVGELLKIVPDVLGLNDPKERLAGALALIRVFFANYDFNFLKYDRDIEYAEFDESVSGYFWHKCRSLCDIAYPSQGERIVLELASGANFLSQNTEYNLAKTALKRRISEHWNTESLVDRKHLEQMLGSVQKVDPQLHEQIQIVARYFRKDPIDLLQGIAAFDVSAGEWLLSHETSERRFLDVYQRLLDKGFDLASQFNTAYRALGILSRTNEAIGFIVNGKTPQENGYFFNDSLVRLYATAKEILENRSAFVKPGMASFLAEASEKAEYMKIVGVTPGIKYFLTKFEDRRFLTEDINAMYDAELSRWTRRTEP
jgi:hypothetical protein